MERPASNCFSDIEGAPENCPVPYPLGHNANMEPIRLIRAAAGMTQQDLAAAAQTSQPAVAAYEAGVKSPTWRTIERIANSVGLRCYPSVVTPLTREKERSLFVHAAVAKEMRSREVEVLAIARENLAKMRSINPRAWRLLDEWERVLQGTVDQVVVRMLDPSELGCDLRQASPFAGVLTAAQRVAVYQSFRCMR